MLTRRGSPLTQGRGSKPHRSRSWSGASRRPSHRGVDREGGAIRIDRPGDAIRTLAYPVASETVDDISGTYRSAEFEAELEIVNAGSSWFAGFKGFLGCGPMMPLLPVGPDVWRLVCNRSLDAPSPGDWTVRALRLTSNKVDALSIGCWLARNVNFERLD